MEDRNDRLYSQDSEVMQITYDEYLELQEKMKEALKVEDVKASVLAQLQGMLIGEFDVEESRPDTPAEEQLTEPEADIPPQQDVPETEIPQQESIPQEDEVMEETETAVESETDLSPEPEAETASEPEAETPSEPAVSARTDVSEVPPIKGEISDHFNRYDESGRLFSIFKQYYTCLNESCGGTVRVTMKDGFCSLWNYDEWEEFAYVDIHEGQLRIAVHPRYTDELKPLNLCEVPRLISSRHNVICVLVGDLNTTVLNVLTRAFAEVGMQIG